MRKPANSWKERGQAIIELAVFGAVIIFLIGSIVRQGMSSAQNENQTMKAMREAMALSLYHSSHGGHGNDGTNARNSASVLIVEDRLSAEFSKYGALSRSPSVVQGSGTFSKNLFMPTDWNEDYNLPVFDLIINGQHFDLTTADFVTKKTASQMYEIAANVPGTGFCSEQDQCPDVNLSERFDLNRNGPGDDPVMDWKRQEMAWQWIPVSVSDVKKKINHEDGQFPSVDVDGDLKREIVYGIHSKSYTDENGMQVTGNFANVMDSQDGDLDFTRAPEDYPTPLLAPGLKQESDIYTLTSDGTYLLIKEGKAYNPETGDLVRSSTGKDQVDVVSRMIRLSANTGRWCPKDKCIGDECVGVTGKPPVEACYDCFSAGNVGKTCFGKTVDIVDGERHEGYVIYVRSRIHENRDRKWITDFTTDVNDL